MAPISVRIGALLIAMILCAAAARGDATAPASAPVTDAGPLNIHITAVRGGAQYRLTGDGKWQKLNEGLDFVEGVEFRTGPRGEIQFTVGTDQVFRVDRLSAVKMLRANLSPDGTIRTDLGMTYGRVSKDVDQPARVHDDHIVSPASTLAVRGTEVSLFDSPPYAPEAVSLTGRGILTNHRKGSSVAFGAKGEGTVGVNNDSQSAAQGKLQDLPVNSMGDFAGQPPAGGAPSPTGPPPPPPIRPPLPPTNALAPGMTGGRDTQMMISMMTTPTPSTMTGGFGLFLDWNSTTPATVVNFTVADPTHQVVSSIAGVSGSQGGVYLGSPVASTTPDLETQLFFGKQGAGFGTTTTGFNTGIYTITETLAGSQAVTGGNVHQNNNIIVNSTLFGVQVPINSEEAETLQITAPPVILTSSNPTAVFTVKAPILATSQFTLVSGIPGGGGGGGGIPGGGGGTISVSAAPSAIVRKSR